MTSTRRPAASPTPHGDPSVSVGEGRRRPGVLALLCLLVLVEGALLVGLAVAFGVELARGTATPGPTLFLMAFMLGIAAVLVAGARGLWAGRRWARSPVLTWQLLLLVLAAGWFGVEPTWWAGGIVVVALVVGVGLVLPRVVAVTTGRGPGRPLDAPDHVDG